ncbi:hypothetical protein R1sor_017231 [Riccia sorocarpa]|uniref:Uncharacterized protein n=1 Tax=Riccia sorocarpa TaxID=122646 RepID=A0ABD3I9K9_9MARC
MTLLPVPDEAVARPPPRDVGSAPEATGSFPETTLHRTPVEDLIRGNRDHLSTTIRQEALDTNQDHEGAPDPGDTTPTHPPGGDLATIDEKYDPLEVPPPVTLPRMSLDSGATMTTDEGGDLEYEVIPPAVANPLLPRRSG